MAIYGVFATEEDDYAPAPTLLGAYKATQSGKYKRADLSGDEPSASGPAQADVLLPTGHVGSGAVHLFARLALGTPSSERFRQGERLLQRGGAARADLLYATTPMFWGQPSPGEVPTPNDMGAHPVDPTAALAVHDAANHVARSGEGPGYEVYLLNPLWAAERRVRAAEAATEHHKDWRKKTGTWAEGPSDMLGGVCHHPAHDRTYLSDQLLQVTPQISEPAAPDGSDGPSPNGTDEPEASKKGKTDLSLDMGRAWAPFSPGEIGVSATGDEAGDFSVYADSDSYLGQFVYGAKCTRAFLVWNRSRATRRALILLFSSYVYQGLLDVQSASSTPPIAAPLVNLYARLGAIGVTVPFDGDLHAMAKDPETDPALKAVTGSPFFKVLTKIGTEYATQKLAFAGAARMVADVNQAGGRGVDAAKEIGGYLMNAGPGAYEAEKIDGEWRLYRAGGSPQSPDVRIVPTKVGPEGSKSTHWTIRPQGQIKQDVAAAADKLKTRAGLDVSMRALNAAVAGYAVFATSSDDTVTDPLNLLKGAAEMAALLDESTTYSDVMKGTVPSSLGRVAEIGSTTADIALAGVDVYRGWTDTDPRGQAVVKDPNWLGIVGHATGGAMALFAYLAQATPLGIVGAVVSGATLLWQAAMEAEAREEADPLRWIGSGSLWGQDFTHKGARAARIKLMKSVQPDPAVTADPRSAKLVSGRERKPIKKVLEAEGKDIIENGFSFPTSVSPRRGPRLSGSGDPSPVQALSLHVGYAYLPTAGTLMVDADVQNPNIPEPAKIKCAIHYVDDGDVRYCVRPVSAGRADPIRPLQEGETLMDRAQSAGWAHAGHGAFEGPNGETLQGSLLSVRVGSAWSSYDEGAEPEAPADATGTAQPRAERAQSGLTAGRKEILEGPSGLDGILQSGSFQVSGQALFHPLQPFDPDPEMPNPEERFVAIEEIQYSYP